MLAKHTIIFQRISYSASGIEWVVRLSSNSKLDHVGLLNAVMYYLTTVCIMLEPKDVNA